MREIEFQQLNQDIRLRQSAAERQILRQSTDEKRVRRRPRDSEEIAILDKLCLLQWQRDVETGKVKMISKREWYYEI